MINSRHDPTADSRPNAETKGTDADTGQTRNSGWYRLLVVSSTHVAGALTRGSKRGMRVLRPESGRSVPSRGRLPAGWLRPPVRSAVGCGELLNRVR